MNVCLSLFSLRFLCVLCVSAVLDGNPTELTVETQRSAAANELGWGQYHLAVAGGSRLDRELMDLWPTHPLPRGGTDFIQAGPLKS